MFIDHSGFGLLNSIILHGGRVADQPIAMQGSNLQPPQPFNFKTPDDWPRWQRRFEQYRVASGLSEDAENKQVNTLLYCLGEEFEAVLCSTNPSEDDCKDYATILQKFNSFFKIRKNVIFERARFNRRNQLEGETAETYIMELYTLAESCEFKTTKEEMIRDRLVVGIRDGSLSERMQMESDLTLERAKQMVRQREAVHEQQEILKNGTFESKDLEEVRINRGFQRGSMRSKPQPIVRSKNCCRCGGGDPRWITVRENADGIRSDPRTGETNGSSTRSCTRTAGNTEKWNF